MPERWWESELIRPFKDELAEIVASNFGALPLWAWKEPQSCMLLPLWREILEQSGTRMSCLFVFRSPVDVAGSLFKRNSIPYDEGVKLWFIYCLTALRDAAGLPMVIIAPAWSPPKAGD